MPGLSSIAQRHHFSVRSPGWLSYSPPDDLGAFLEQYASHRWVRRGGSGNSPRLLICQAEKLAQLERCFPLFVTCAHYEC